MRHSARCAIAPTIDQHVSSKDDASPPAEPDHRHPVETAPPPHLYTEQREPQRSHDPIDRQAQESSWASHRPSQKRSHPSHAPRRRRSPTVELRGLAAGSPTSDSTTSATAAVALPWFVNTRSTMAAFTSLTAPFDSMSRT